MPKFNGIIKNNQLIMTVILSKEPLQENEIQNNRYEARALIDIGATNSVIRKIVVDKLDLVSIGKFPTITASGSENCNVYNLMVAIPVQEILGRKDNGDLIGTLHMKGFKRRVSEMPDLNQNYDMLLGMDIISRCMLIVDGNNYTFCI